MRGIEYITWAPGEAGGPGQRGWRVEGRAQGGKGLGRFARALTGWWGFGACLISSGVELDEEVLELLVAAVVVPHASAVEGEACPHRQYLDSRLSFLKNSSISASSYQSLRFVYVSIISWETDKRARAFELSRWSQHAQTPVSTHSGAKIKSEIYMYCQLRTLLSSSPPRRSRWVLPA